MENIFQGAFLLISSVGIAISFIRWVYSMQLLLVGLWFNIFSDEENYPLRTPFLWIILYTLTFILSVSIWTFTANALFGWSLPELIQAY